MTEKIFKDFNKWADSRGYGFQEISEAEDGWNARQPEIDDLRQRMEKAEGHLKQIHDASIDAFSRGASVDDDWLLHLLTKYFAEKRKE